MQRIRQRKHGRDGNSPHALGASHAIKIGFDARKQGSDRPLPGKLRGFLLCRDTVGNDDNRLVDMDCMAKYGVNADAIAKAKQLQFKAPDGILPTELNFVLAQDARRLEGGWSYPGTFGEEFECWGKLGLFCHGDGEIAQRRQDDGTRKEIECVPHGKTGAAAADFCPHSVKGDCKGKMRLVLCLYIADPHTGKPSPVSDALGWEARFRFDTSSGYAPLGVLQALDQAADRLKGNIAGIPGTLSFAVQRKRTGKADSPVGVTGQVHMSLSEQEISKREREQWERQLEEHRVFSLPSAERKALPEAPAVEREEEPDVIAGREYGDDAAGEGEPENPESAEAPQAQSIHGTDLRARVGRGWQMLRDSFPDTKDGVGFELHSRWGVSSVEDVPEEHLAECLKLLQEIYKEESNAKGATS